jgi:dTDP-4-dehydrorhamnose reductase
MADISKDYNILIFGANGWIGTKVYNLLKDKYNVYKSQYRATDSQIELEIKMYNITHIMSFIGRTHGNYNGEKINTIDYLEKPGKLKENINDNLYSPLYLAMLSNKYGIHYTYLGTGCIFNSNDDNDNDFDEKDLPNFFGSSYSIVKGYTDQIMNMFENTLNVRIRMPITDENNNRNFISKITKYKKICSMPNSMTVLNELLPIMIDMSLKYETGTINLTNPGTITHNEILTMYKEIVDPDFTWENFTIEEQNQILLSKRSNNQLNTDKLKSMYPHVLNIKDSVRNILTLMKN